jgi:hypothetical protein
MFVALVALGLVGLQAGGSVPQAVIVLLSAAAGLGVWHSQEESKRANELRARLITNKKSLYGIYVDVLRGIFRKGANKRSFERELTKLNAFVFGAMLIASDEVILAQDRFMRVSKVGDAMLLPALADVVLAMRRDAGEATALRPMDVLAAFIRDIENHAAAFELWEKEKRSAWPDPEPSAQRVRPMGSHGPSPQPQLRR